MPQFSKEFLDALRTRVDSVQVVGEVVSLERSGKNFKGKCPFHQEKTPSFYIYPTDGMYHCFGCDAHGSIIDFVMKTRHLQFPAAVKELAQKAGVALPKSRYPQISEKETKHLQKLFAAVEQANIFYQGTLRSSDKPKSYLSDRGLQPSTIEKFGIGYAPDSFHSLKEKLSHFEEETLLESGLMIKNDKQQSYDRFRDRIIFPIHNTRGQVVGFGGRVLGRDQIPKYINSPESRVFSKRRELYGLHQILQQSMRRQSALVVVEGYMDVVMLSQHGIQNSVAPLGTALTENHYKILHRYCNEVICCFDGDEAGRKAAWRAVLKGFWTLTKDFLIRVVLLPEGQDPDSFVQDHGAEAFQELLNTATPASDYFFDVLTEGIDLESVEARVQVVERALPDIQSIPYSTFRNAMLVRLAETTGLSLENIQSHDSRLRGNYQSSGTNQTGYQRSSSIRVSRGERNVVNILVDEVGWVRRIPEELMKSVRLFRQDSVLCDVITRIRDDNLRNFSELLASYSGTNASGFLENISRTRRPSIRVHDLGDGPIDALESIVVRLEAEYRRKSVPHDASDDAKTAFRRIYKPSKKLDEDDSNASEE